MLCRELHIEVADEAVDAWYASGRNVLSIKSWDTRTREIGRRMASHLCCHIDAQLAFQRVAAARPRLDTFRQPAHRKFLLA